MNVFMNNTQNFVKIFKENLRHEIQKNTPLNRQLSIYRDRYNSYVNTLAHSAPIVIFAGAITPLRLTDALLYQIIQEFNCRVPKVIHKSVIGSPLRHMFTWAERISIPQYYGGNIHKKHLLKLKSEQLPVQRDESAISNIETSVLPNIFFNGKYIDKDKNIEDIMDGFKEDIRKKLHLRAYDFNHIKCIDLRNVETDGYNSDEEIEFNFHVQMRVKYFVHAIKNKVLYYKCKIKFDGDDKVLSFSYDLM